MSTSGPAADSATATHEPSTRERILDAALRLFTERGYDGTSLREIAEDIGVSKAALYYHFTSKDEILAGVYGAFRQELRQLVAWGQSEAMTPQRRDELLVRLGEQFYGDTRQQLMMLHEDQAAVRAVEHTSATGRQQAMDALIELVGLLAPPGAGPKDLIRTRAAMVTIMFNSSAKFPLTMAGEIPLAERKRLTVEVAREILGW